MLTEFPGLCRNRELAAAEIRALEVCFNLADTDGISFEEFSRVMGKWADSGQSCVSVMRLAFAGVCFSVYSAIFSCARRLYGCALSSLQRPISVTQGGLERSRSGLAHRCVMLSYAVLRAADTLCAT